MIKFTIFVICMLLLTNSYAQLVLSGHVRDRDGNGIGGVSVGSNKGTTESKSTEDGSFRLVVSDSSGTLIITSTLFDERVELFTPQDIISGIQVIIDVNAQLIDEVEVVNTGYQQIPKERATGAFATVSEKVFNQQVSTDVLGRLEAVANGVSFNRTTVNSQGLTIRGVSSIQGSKQPLIVVDNFPYDGDLQNINPNDVANITLLKDAAAASIWGARAGNGVIVITTKTGKLNQQMQISTNANITVGNIPDLYYQPVMSTADFIEIEQFLFSNKHRFSDTLSRNYAPFTPLYELMFRNQRGEISNDVLRERTDDLRGVDIRNEYARTMYTPLMNQQYAATISGGSERATWYFSSGYDRNLDEVNAGYKRLNVNFQNTYMPAKGVRLSSGIRYTNSGSSNGRTAYGTIRMNNGELPPYTKFTDDQGHFLPITRLYRQSYVDTVGGTDLLDWNYYMDDYKHLSQSTNLSDMVLNLGVNLAPLSWLNMDIKYQFQQQRSDIEMTHGSQSFLARNLINQYTQLQSGQSPKYIVPRGAVHDPSHARLVSHALRAQINIDRQWGVGSLAGVAGMELKDLSNRGQSTRFYGYNPEVGTFAGVDPTNTYPSIVNGSRTFIPNMTSFTGTTNRFVSAFSNLAYTYDNRYTVSASLRRDASNLFGVNTNDKWNLLWSMGGAWNIGQESFYDHTWLPYLKLRVTHGFSGNVDLGRSAVTTINFASMNNPFTQLRLARFNQFGDPELRWEKVGMTNMAIDFATIGNRLSGSIDFFIKKGTDLLGPAAIDYTTGTSTSLTKNVASIRGKGMDVLLNSINIASPFRWTSNLNMSWYRDEVLDYFREDMNGRFYVTGQTPAFSGIIGKPLFSFYSFQWRGLDPNTGDPLGAMNGRDSKDYNALLGDSTQIQDLVYHGSAIPTVFGSLGNTFEWKNFDLSIRLLYNFGYYYRRQGVNYHSLFSGGIGNHEEYAHRWHQPGDEQYTQVPSMIYPTTANRDAFYSGSEELVERGDHIRLQYINVGYDLPTSLLSRIAIQRANVYANAANLGILWSKNKDGLDPEYRVGMPPVRTFSIGIRLTF